MHLCLNCTARLNAAWHRLTPADVIAILAFDDGARKQPTRTRWVLFSGNHRDKLSQPSFPHTGPSTLKLENVKTYTRLFCYLLVCFFVFWFFFFYLIWRVYCFRTVIANTFDLLAARFQIICCFIAEVGLHNFQWPTEKYISLTKQSLLSLYNFSSFLAAI